MIETKTLHILKNIKITFLAVKPVKLFFIEKKKMLSTELLKQFLKNIIIAKM